MRIHIGAVPETADFLPENPWQPVREPTPWVMQLFALPIGIAACAAVGAAWIFLTPLREVQFDSPALLLGAIFIMIPVHEVIHALVHPGAGRSADSILGFWPSRLLAYAHYSGELSRARFIAILLMPLLVLTFVPLVVCALTGWSSTLLASVSALNALCACGDIFGVGVLLFQIPRDAVVRNQGYRTYWRDAGPTANSAQGEEIA